MSPSVEIDDEVWDELKAQAEPFVDTPNTVLRRLLGLASASAAGERSPVSPRAGRAPMGSLLPEAEYELPILRALADRGGSAPARDVVKAVGEMVADQLTERDREKLRSGGERWQNRIQFSRLRMKERGLIKSGSPRGLWELAEPGTQVLADRATN